MSIKVESENGCGCFAALVLMVLAVLVAMLSSCSTQREIEHVMHHDTICQNSVVHDSVDRWHTHYEFVRGDTLHIVDTFWRDKWHTAHDTAYKTVVDVQTKEVERVVEKKVYVWWPLWVAVGIIGAAVVAVVVFEKAMNKLAEAEGE